MTLTSTKPRKVSQFGGWIKASAVAVTVMAAAVATMVLAASNSAQSAQAKTYRAEGTELRALERHLPWGGAPSGYQLLF